MIRPRGGNFVYSKAELRAMETDIAAMRSAGFAGVVFGALTSDHRLDVPVLKRLCGAANGMGLTLHRAVDEMRSPRDAVLTAVELGFERILTSGGAARAVDGVDELSAMLRIAGENIEIMAGSGVSFQNISKLRTVGISSFHASCRVKNEADDRRSLDVDVLNRTQNELRLSG